MSQKTAEILQQLEVGVQSLLDSENFKTYLRFLATFHSYSFRNSLLIHIQCQQRGIVPTLCASYRDWQKRHRHVRRGEKGIAIIAPHTYRAKKPETDEDTSLLGFHLAYTYDVSQTEPDDDAGEVPEICHRLTGELADASLLETLVAISPVHVSFEPLYGGANGFFRTDTLEIVVDSSNDQIMQAKTLIHEQAHCCHHMIDPDFDMCPREDKEVIAEACAYTVSTYLGLSTDEYSFGYLAGWGSTDQKELKKHFGLIRQISDQIISEIEAINNREKRTA